MTSARPMLVELLEYMDRTRSALMATAGSMNSTFACIRPHEGMWSAADNLEHLARVEESVARLIEKSIAKAREQGVGPAIDGRSVMSSLDGFGLVDAAIRLEAPDLVAPAGDRPVAESLTSLEKSRIRVRDALEGAADIDLRSIKRQHLRLGEIDLCQWALFLAQHEERHRQQIERTLAAVTELACESAPIV